jgi:hypothetical protein
VAILNSGRASRFASAAEKTEIDVIFETFRELNATLSGRFDEVNSATRRLRL